MKKLVIKMPCSRCCGTGKVPYWDAKGRHESECTTCENGTVEKVMYVIDYREEKLDNLMAYHGSIRAETKEDA